MLGVITINKDTDLLGNKREMDKDTSKSGKYDQVMECHLQLMSQRRCDTSDKVSRSRQWQVHSPVYLITKMSKDGAPSLVSLQAVGMAEERRLRDTHWCVSGGKNPGSLRWWETGSGFGINLISFHTCAGSGPV